MERTTKILEDAGPELMEAMVGLALSPLTHPVVRGSVGMKLLDKIIPTKSSPLVQIGVDNRRSYSITSHLGIPTEATSAREIAAEARKALPTPQEEPKPSRPKIDAAVLTDRTYPKHRAAPSITPPGSSPPILTPDAIDTEPFERAPNPFEKKSQDPDSKVKSSW